jgi:hypothetical protein
VLGTRNLFGGAEGIKVNSHGDEDSIVSCFSKVVDAEIPPAAAGGVCPP